MRLIWINGEFWQKQERDALMSIGLRNRLGLLAQDDDDGGRVTVFRSAHDLRS